MYWLYSQLTEVRMVNILENRKFRMILTIGRKIPLKQSKTKVNLDTIHKDRRIVKIYEKGIDETEVLSFSHPVAKTLEMQKWPGHSSFDSESLASLPSHPFCFRAASPGPFPSPVEILVVPSVVITLTCLPYNFPHLIDLTISACAVLYFIPPKSCYFCAHFSLSLLCNLTSSSWFPVICNNKGKRKFPPSHNYCRKGDSLPGPETGLLSNTRKWIVWGDTCADKARDFIGKGAPGRAAR